MDVPGDWTMANDWTVSEDCTAGTVEANGTTLQYYRTGDGHPVVMAHGFTDNGRCWGRLVSDLAADYDVVAYDARAHGRSAAPETGYTVEDRVADLVGLVDALGLDDPILYGHSQSRGKSADRRLPNSFAPGFRTRRRRFPTSPRRRSC